MHRYWRWLLYSFLLILFVFVFIYRKELGYGLGQAKGQISILMDVQKVDDVLKDKSYPDSLKKKIRLIQEIRTFAFDSLGLVKNDNYTTFYDQKGKAILWNVTASEPYELKAKVWKFPFLGTFSYKGFFVLEKAKAEEHILSNEGWDTSIDEVSGWSTLGWFKDPILSSMLYRSEGSLANLIIHELTHGTLYVKNNVEFNENLASFVGEKGALMFLRSKYGNNSPQLMQYIKRRTFNDDFKNLVLKQSAALDSFYKAIAHFPEAEKKVLKEKKLSEIKDILIEKAREGGYSEKSGFISSIKGLNNTYFLDYRRYTQNLDVFEKEMKASFQGNLKDYLQYLRTKYPSL